MTLTPRRIDLCFIRHSGTQLVVTKSRTYPGGVGTGTTINHIEVVVAMTTVLKSWWISQRIQCGYFSSTR